MVERGGFEPPKAAPADLQSAPFDRSGTSPQQLRASVKEPTINNKDHEITNITGAGDGNRTRNLLITNQLLYH